jgi:hypothetical protein
MGLHRDRKSSPGDGPDDQGKHPKGEAFKLGDQMTITISQVGDLYNESAINVKVDSSRSSLMEPVETEIGKEPSAADKIIQIIKVALRERGMTVLQEKQKPGGPQIPDAAQHRVKLAVDEFISYKPGGSGVVIRAERGYYDGRMFNAEAILREAGDVLHKLEEQMKNVRTVQAFEDRIDHIYKGVDLYSQPLDEALRKPLERVRPVTHAGVKHEGRPVELRAATAETGYRKAINARIPDGLIGGDYKADAVDKITKGVLCAGEACWAKAEGSNRGKEGDELVGHVKAVLAQHSPKTISDTVMGFLVGEVCDAIYAEKDKQAGVEVAARY